MALIKEVITKLTKKFEIKAGERDWPEDFGHENGEYFCNCSSCGRTFVGYKRRTICKVCANKDAA